MTPYLSVVLTGRHDNYGGDFNERFFRALRFNQQQLAERQISHEFVFVEWNPVPGRPWLAELLTEAVRDIGAASIVRCVVDPRYHTACTQNPRLDYLEYVAKNVGIRRASGRFVLATNTDVFLGRGPLDAIGSQRLEAGTVYRAARVDLKLGADQSAITWDALEDSRNHVRTPVLTAPLYAGGSGDFILLDRDTFHRLRGFNEVYRRVKVSLDYNFLVKAHGAGVPIADIGGAVYHVNHLGSFRISKQLFRDVPADAPWGDQRWHSRFVVYENPDSWGLGAAPERVLEDGTRYLEFDWNAAPPLIDLRRVVLPLAVRGEPREPPDPTAGNQVS